MLDGIDSGDTGGTTANVMTSNGLTTTSANDIIIAIIGITATTGIGGFASISDGNGLEWTSRVTNLSGPSAITDVEVWYAVSPIPLTGDLITVRLGVGAPNRAMASMIIFALSGTTNTFDVNGSLPANASNISSNTSAVTISTSNANDTLLGLVVLASNGNGIATPGVGFTEIINDEAGPSTDGQYRIVNVIQNNLSVSCLLDNADEWVIIGDAIINSSGPPPTPGTVTFLILPSKLQVKTT